MRKVIQFGALLLLLTPLTILNGCSGVVSAGGASTLPPQISALLSPLSLTFSNVVVGQKTSLTLTVTNTGLSSITLNQVTSSGTQFSYSGVTLPLTLAAGQTANVNVWFTSSTGGTISGTLTLNFSDSTGAKSTATVPLTATAVTPKPQLSMSPASVNYGTVTIGGTRNSAVTITNAGSADLTISLISVSGAAFGVSGVTTPKTITAGQSAVLNTTYTPTLAENDTGSISVTSNDPQTPTATVALAGTGTSTSGAPTITTQPGNQSVTAGQTATFTVVAGGTAPLSYQWQKNGVNIAGASAASYTTPVTATTDSGSTFDVVVSNTAGNITSNAATLTVTAAAVAPTITTQPGNQTVTAGQTATFTVAAGGTAPLSYQWQKNGVNIAGAISASYTTPLTVTTDSGSTFRVVVTNTAGNITSNAATLTVTAVAVAPTITTQPGNQTVTAGQTATFTVVAGGTAPLNYQWQKNGVNIGGATGASYTTPVTATTDSGSTFDVVVSNTAGSITSNAATLTVTAAVAAPTITTQPGNQSVTAGQAATFTVAAGGTAPLSYQWQKNGVNIAGAISASYTTPVTATTDSGSTFRVVVTNTAGNITSNAATLTVTAVAVAPTVTTQPANQSVTAGQTATFTVVAGGTAPLSYQWQKNGVNIAGAISASYTTPVTATTDSGSTFRVVVSNTAGNITSNAATLTVNPAPAPAIQVSSTTINFGSDVVGTTTSQPLIVTNTGNATLTLTQVNVSGATFSVSGFSLPLSVLAGQQATITVAFLPTSAGALSGSISIVSNAPSSPTAVSLSGTGVAATRTLGVSPASLSFGSVTTGTSSASQNVTITNTGNAGITISQITVSGAGYSMTGGSAPVTLNPSQNLVLAVSFSPTVAGSVSGSISITSNASGSPATVSLSGTGVAPIQHSVALSWTASTSTVSGYNVYRGTASGGPYAKINSSLVAGVTYTDATVASGTTYYYVTTAVDSSGNESAYSNEVSAPIP